MSKKFLSEIGDLITDKYESDLEEISKNHSGHNREWLLENLEKWHKFMIAELSELTLKEAGFDVTVNKQSNNDNLLF